MYMYALILIFLHGSFFHVDVWKLLEMLLITSLGLDFCLIELGSFSYLA